MTQKSSFDYVIIGAGIVGLTSAYAIIQKKKDSRILIIEKEASAANHQTGRNSGVIHSGIYYKPNSFKANNCIKGSQLLFNFCDSEKIPYQKCGKLILAINTEDEERLDKIYENGILNGLKNIRKISPSEIKEIEPEAFGTAAIHIPDAGIVSYRTVCEALVEILSKAGVKFEFETKVIRIAKESRGFFLTTNNGNIISGAVIGCCGVYSDELHLENTKNKKSDFKMVPFKGEYYSISGDFKNKINGLIYPVPNPKFPFLGVHIHKTIYGEVECGPNAILALGKENYTLFHSSILNAHKYIFYPGFLKFAAKNISEGTYELKRSIFKNLFVRDLQKLVPGVNGSDLSVEKSKVGIRAQLLNEDGTLVDDFKIDHDEGFLNVVNAPSPAATSSFAIADELLKYIL